MTGNPTPTAQAGDAQLARARQHLTDLTTRLAIDGTTGEASSAAIFDIARPGLDYFRAFGESHARLEGTSFDFESDIAARYNAQREIAFGRIRADAERLANLFTAMTDTDVDFRNSAGSLFDYWQGEAADAAKGRMSGFLTSAGSVWGGIQRFADALLTACGTAEHVVLDKATAVLDLAAGTIDGLTPTDVTLLVDLAIAGSASALSDSQIVNGAELLGVAMLPEACRANPLVFKGLQNSARDHLDDVFVPDYDTRHTAFGKACTAAADRLAEAWETLETALGELNAYSPETFAPPGSPATPTQHHTTTNQPARTETTATTIPTQAPASATLPPAPAPAPTPATPPPAPTPAPAPAVPTPPPASPGQTGNSPSPDDPPDGSSDSAVGVPTGDAARTGVGSVGSTNSSPQQAQPGPGQPPAQTQPAASGYAYPPPRMTQGGGDDDYARKVPLKGKPVREAPNPAAPAGVIGDEDDPAHYNEAQRFDDYLAPVERPVTENVEEVEKKKEPTQTAWRLTKDGELEAVEIPVTPRQDEGKPTP